MKAFDTDVLTELFWGHPDVVARMAAVPRDQQYIPVVVVDEMLRGRLDAIRKSQATPRWLTLERAYDEFVKTLEDLREFRILPYPAAAHALFLAWRAAKIRVGTNDLRIAAIALAHSATLVTRNARDFAQVPGLIYEVWP